MRLKLQILLFSLSFHSACSEEDSGSNVNVEKSVPRSEAQVSRPEADRIPREDVDPEEDPRLIPSSEIVEVNPRAGEDVIELCEDNSPEDGLVQWFPSEGIRVIRAPVVIPDGCRLEIFPGTQVELLEEASIEVNSGPDCDPDSTSGLQLKGTEKFPITIISQVNHARPIIDFTCAPKPELNFVQNVYFYDYKGSYRPGPIVRVGYPSQLEDFSGAHLQCVESNIWPVLEIFGKVKSLESITFDSCDTDVVMALISEDSLDGLRTAIKDREGERVLFQIVHSAEQTPHFHVELVQPKNSNLAFVSGGILQTWTAAPESQIESIRIHEGVNLIMAEDEKFFVGLKRIDLMGTSEKPIRLTAEDGEKWGGFYTLGSSPALMKYVHIENVDTVVSFDSAGLGAFVTTEMEGMSFSNASTTASISRLDRTDNYDRQRLFELRRKLFGPEVALLELIKDFEHPLSSAELKASLQELERLRKHHPRKGSAIATQLVAQLMMVPNVDDQRAVAAALSEYTPELNTQSRDFFIQKLIEYLRMTSRLDPQVAGALTSAMRGLSNDHMLVFVESFINNVWEFQEVKSLDWNSSPSLSIVQQAVCAENCSAHAEWFDGLFSNRDTDFARAIFDKLFESMKSSNKAASLRETWYQRILFKIGDAVVPTLVAIVTSPTAEGINSGADRDALVSLFKVNLREVPNQSTTWGGVRNGEIFVHPFRLVYEKHTREEVLAAESILAALFQDGNGVAIEAVFNQLVDVNGSFSGKWHLIEAIRRAGPKANGEDQRLLAAVSFWTDASLKERGKIAQRFSPPRNSDSGQVQDDSQLKRNWSNSIEGFHLLKTRSKIARASLLNKDFGSEWPKKSFLSSFPLTAPFVMIYEVIWGDNPPKNDI